MVASDNKKLKYAAALGKDAVQNLTNNKHMRTLLLLLFLMPLAALSQPDLIIRHINVIDVKTGSVKSNQYVTIYDGKIALIRRDNKRSQLAKNQVDGSGKYLIPGLWDMHSHNHGNINYTKDFIIPIMLANGITGFRDMWGNKEEIALRDSIKQGLVIAPRMMVGTPLVNGPATFFDGSISIKNVEQVPAIVDSLQSSGYDFLKVYSHLRSDIFDALAAYCKQKKFPIAGHVPVGVTATAASNAGMQTFEHLFGLRKSFFPNADQLCKEWENEVSETMDFAALLQVLNKSESPRPPFDTALARQVLAVLVKNQTAVVPTLCAIFGTSLDVDTLKRITPLTYVKPTIEKQWYEARTVINFEKDFGEQSMQLLNFLHKQGVLILAGTDNENPFVIQGVSIHDELQYYVQAGLTPLQALQTATLNPAIFLHKENELGTVEVGKVADLVVLEGNPLEDIANTRKTNAVIIKGHLIDKAQIERMLNTLKEKAGR